MYVYNVLDLRLEWPELIHARFWVYPHVLNWHTIDINGDHSNRGRWKYDLDPFLLDQPDPWPEAMPTILSKHEIHRLATQFFPVLSTAPTTPSEILFRQRFTDTFCLWHFDYTLPGVSWMAQITGFFSLHKIPGNKRMGPIMMLLSPLHRTPLHYH